MHIIGADQLLAVVPNRDPRRSVSLAMLSPEGKLGDKGGSSRRRSGYNKWSVDENLSSKCMESCFQRGFVAQLAEHSTGITDVMGSNPVEASEFFLGFLCNCFSCFICEDHFH